VLLENLILKFGIPFPFLIGLDPHPTRFLTQPGLGASLHVSATWARGAVVVHPSASPSLCQAHVSGGISPPKSFPCAPCSSMTPPTDAIRACPTTRSFDRATSSTSPPPSLSCCRWSTPPRLLPCCRLPSRHRYRLHSLCRLLPPRCHEQAMAASSQTRPSTDAPVHALSRLPCGCCSHT
jgi:hypothetical protein